MHDPQSIPSPSSLSFQPRVPALPLAGFAAGEGRQEEGPGLKDFQPGHSTQMKDAKLTLIPPVNRKFPRCDA